MPTESQLLITREPGGTSLGTALRQLLLHPPEDKAPEPLPMPLQPMVAEPALQKVNKLAAGGHDGAKDNVVDEFKSLLVEQDDVKIILQLEYEEF